MHLSAILFDTRNLPPEEKKEVYSFLHCVSEIGPTLVSVGNQFAGYLAFTYNDPSTFLESIPHQCPYADVTGWDLSDAENVFRAAFKDRYHKPERA